MVLVSKGTEHAGLQDVSYCYRLRQMILCLCHVIAVHFCIGFCK